MIKVEATKLPEAEVAKKSVDFLEKLIIFITPTLLSNGSKGTSVSHCKRNPCIKSIW